MLLCKLSYFITTHITQHHNETVPVVPHKDQRSKKAAQHTAHCKRKRSKQQPHPAPPRGPWPQTQTHPPTPTPKVGPPPDQLTHAEHRRTRTHCWWPASVHCSLFTVHVYSLHNCVQRVALAHALAHWGAQVELLLPARRPETHDAGLVRGAQVLALDVLSDALAQQPRHLVGRALVSGVQWGGAAR